MPDRLDDRFEMGFLQLELVQLELVRLEQLLLELIELEQFCRLEFLQLEFLELELLELERDRVDDKRRRLGPLGPMIEEPAPSRSEREATLGTLDQRVALLIAFLGTLATAVIVADAHRIEQVVSE